MTILIAGGGIGGLTAALSLHAAGIMDVLVLEAAPTIEPIGVGINLPPHATRELAELGLGDRLSKLGVPTSYLSYYDPFGRLIWAEPRGITAGYNWPQYSVHRGKLQKMLLEAVLARLGPASVRTGCRIVEVRSRDDGAEILVQTQERLNEVLNGSVLIGADGIRSRVREQLFPAFKQLAWNGWVMWRGITHGKSFLDGATMVIVGDERQRVVVYPIDLANGKTTLNWILSRPGDLALDRGNWNRESDVNELAKFVEGWSYDWLDISALVRRATAVYEYPMVDLDPLPRWTVGRTTLLGDAAHAMYPFGSNGASQAIIDARILARELAISGDPSVALRSYEALRREGTAKIQLANRRQASDVMTRVSELARQQVFGGAAHELRSVEQDYKRIAGFEAESLNARPSWSIAAPASSRNFS